MNTLFLRLAGPMQSWGTSSRLQLRRTDGYPSKSGVLGLLLCAKGVRRNESAKALKPLANLLMGVRVDRPGTRGWDYHTAGAGEERGLRKAEGGIKITPGTGEPETLLSRREYLFDASFLVVLQGNADTIRDCVSALNDPVWPIFLGRKCCIPAEPVFIGTGHFATMTEALISIPYVARQNGVDGNGRPGHRTLDAYAEHPQGSPPPDGARLVYDVPRGFGFNNHGARWVIAERVLARVETQKYLLTPRPVMKRVDYRSKQWRDARDRRLKYDRGLCVFCKAPAKDVHHVDYSNVGKETNDDLRSLCKLCHDACTMLKYGNDMERTRIDPSDPALQMNIRSQIKRILEEGHFGRRRELLTEMRAARSALSGNPHANSEEDS